MSWQFYKGRASGRWDKYPNLRPIKNLQRLIDDIEKNPLHLFWG
jgi:hypothetical protein